MNDAPAKRITALLLLLCLFAGLLGGCAGNNASGSPSAPASSVPQSDEAPSSPASAGLSAGSTLPQSDEGTPAPMAAEGIFTDDCEYAVQAEAAYMINEESGVVLYAKNAHTPLVAASLVKMMTCLVVMDEVEDIDAETITAETWVFNQLYGLNASTADIRKGETLTVRELLYAMLLPSANEAALMLAGYVGQGYMPNFLYLMNYKAQQLGCTGTVFTDPNGLSEENLTTAHDMALIVREFMQNDTLVEIAATDVYEMAAHNHDAPYNILSTNRFLTPSDPYALAYPKIAPLVVAGKTGSLGEWQNFASMAQTDGMAYICVVLHSPNEADAVATANEYSRYRPALAETGELYTWAFSSFGVQAALDPTKPVTEVRVKYSTDHDSVKLRPATDMKTLLPLDGQDEIELTFEVPDMLPAPVEAGQEVGRVTLSLRGRVLGSTALVTVEAVPRNTYKFLLQRTGEIMNTTVVKVVIALVVLAVAGYFVLLWYATRRQARRKAALPPKTPPPNEPPSPPRPPQQS